MKCITRYFKLKILFFKIARHIELLNTINKTIDMIQESAKTQIELEIYLNTFNLTHREITLNKKHFLKSDKALVQLNLLVTRSEETLEKIQEITAPTDGKVKHHFSNRGIDTTFIKLNHLMFTTRQYIENTF